MYLRCIAQLNDWLLESKKTLPGACLRDLPPKLALKRTDDQIKARFSNLKTRFDVADILELPIQKVMYYAYRNRAYATFTIPKRRGGVRAISAPSNNLKIIQANLNRVLRLVYKTRAVVHGFALGKSIVSNASSHIKRRYVFNIDLKDFFGSINFGRVRGMLMAQPYNTGNGAATLIAQLCTFNGVLPQGAPTSPIITNMICGRLDTELIGLALTHHCRYTRYADDITFSAATRSFPEAIARLDTTGDATRTLVGDECDRIIKSNGFEINLDKVRLQLQKERQEVTGLVTNRFVNVPRSYVRHLRGLLHAWEKHGADKTAVEFFGRHDSKRRGAGDAELLRRVVRGKINFVGNVRGTDDPIFLKLLSSFAKLNPGYEIEVPDEIDLGFEDRGDDLLPILRKKAFLKDFPTAVQSASSRSPVSLLVIDLDHFKAVNDKYGHAVGDEVLVDCAKAVSGRCSGKGQVYRYGGEEIVVLLPNFTTKEAEILAELIRSDVATSPAGSVKATISVSIGVGTAPDDAPDHQKLLEVADGALYAAKHSGRNCVRTAKTKFDMP